MMDALGKMGDYEVVDACGSPRAHRRDRDGEGRHERRREARRHRVEAQGRQPQAHPRRRLHQRRSARGVQGHVARVTPRQLNTITHLAMKTMTTTKPTLRARGSPPLRPGVRHRRHAIIAGRSRSRRRRKAARPAPASPPTSSTASGSPRSAAPSSADTVIESWSAIGIRIHYSGTSHPAHPLGDKLTGDRLRIDGQAEQVRRSTTTRSTARSTARPCSSRATPRSSLRSRWRSPATGRTVVADRHDHAARAAGSRVVQGARSTTRCSRSSTLRALQARLVAAHVHEGRHVRRSGEVVQRTSSTRMNGVTDHAARDRRQLQVPSAVKANLKDPTKIGLALSSFGMYFSTAARRRAAPADDERLDGVLHHRPPGARRADRPRRDGHADPRPARSTFGRQLLDMGAMPAADSRRYARTMMELLVKSDNKRRDAPVGDRPLGDDRLVRGDGDRGLPRRRVR